MLRRPAPAHVGPQWSRTCLPPTQGPLRPGLCPVHSSIPLLGPALTRGSPTAPFLHLARGAARAGSSVSAFLWDKYLWPQECWELGQLGHDLILLPWDALKASQHLGEAGMAQPQRETEGH